VGPADGVVVVGIGSAEFIEAGGEELRSFEGCQAIEVGHFVIGPVEGAFGGGAVVADDVVDEGVVEDLEFLEHFDDPADVMIGVFEEAGVDLHLPAEDGFEGFGHVGPGGDFLGARGELAGGGNDAELFLAGEDLVAELIPTLVELALVLVGPFLGGVMGCVGGARGVIDEEGLIGGEGFLLADPLDGFVGHVDEQVVALFREFS
jgi:hypothetical protein